MLKTIGVGILIGFAAGLVSGFMLKIFQVELTPAVIAGTVGGSVGGAVGARLFSKPKAP